VGLAWSQFRSRDHEGALITLKPLLGGEGAEMAFLYGASLVNLQRPAEAIVFLKDAIAKDPRMLPARAALGQALLQTGKAAEAIPLLREAVAGDEDGSVHFQLFRAYQITGRSAEAREALEGYQRLRAAPGR
jgi:predicted Zn-dependent protease